MKILADAQNVGGFVKCWRLTEIYADNGILAGVKISAPGEISVDLEKVDGRLMFGLGGISNC
jgi:hypothetical protein